MIVDKVPWVNHSGKECSDLALPAPPGNNTLNCHPRQCHAAGTPIFSVDVDASGQRLVTCGQDNKIRVWSTKAILHESAEVSGAAIIMCSHACTRVHSRHITSQPKHHL